MNTLKSKYVKKNIVNIYNNNLNINITFVNI